MNDTLVESILIKFNLQYKPISGGRKFLLKCPFHDDRTASLTITSDIGLYGCFACGTTGPNIKHFLSRLKGEEIDIRDYISEKDEFEMGLQKIYNQSASNILQYDEYINFKQVHDFYSQFFVDALNHNEAKNYLLSRNFNSNIIKRFKLQYCIAERFENRIIIPYYKNGMLIGFNSRLIGVDKKFGKELRYLYLTSSKFFEGYLYNYENISNKDYCILVEGPFDLMWLVQNGYKNVISTLTTHVSTEHLIRICEFKKIIFCFDNDENGKGKEGMIRVAEKILSLFPEKEIYTSELPQWKDPNECSGAELRESFKKLKRIKQNT